MAAENSTRTPRTYREQVLHNLLKPLVKGGEHMLFPPDNSKANYSYRRRFLTNLLSPIFRGEMHMDPEELARYQALVDQGYGTVFVYSHFSQKDPFEAAKYFSFSDPVMTTRKDASPIRLGQSIPQVPEGMGAFWRFFNSAVIPVVTKSDTDKVETKMRKKSTAVTDEEKAQLDKDIQEKKNALRRQGNSSKFLEASVVALSEGGSSYIAPAATRMDHHGDKFEGRTMSSLVAKLDENHVENVVFVMVGLGIKGATNYHKDKVGGFNLLKKYKSRATIATMEEMKAELAAQEKPVLLDPKKPTSYKPVDQWFHDKLGTVVPEAFKHPTEKAPVKRRISAKELGTEVVHLVKGKFARLH